MRIKAIVSLLLAAILSSIAAEAKALIVTYTGLADGLDSSGLACGVPYCNFSNAKFTLTYTFNPPPGSIQYNGGGSSYQVSISGGSIPPVLVYDYAALAIDGIGVYFSAWGDTAAYDSHGITDTAVTSSTTQEISSFSETPNYTLGDVQTTATNPGISSNILANYSVSGALGEGTYNVRFGNSGGVMGDLELQTLSVSSAVPEPSTWFMMISGFATVGFMAYRRRRNCADF